MNKYHLMICNFIAIEVIKYDSKPVIIELDLHFDFDVLQVVVFLFYYDEISAPIERLKLVLTVEGIRTGFKDQGSKN